MLSLTELCVAFNKLKRIPKLSPNVELINVPYNQISELNIPSLEHLRRLTIAYNNIKDLGNIHFPSLQYLKMDGTQIENIDFDLYPSLQYISLTDSPVKLPLDIPEHICELATDNFEFFQAHQCQKVRYIHKNRCWGFGEVKGTRSTMEDTIILRKKNNFEIFAVLDGHGGRETANIVSHFLPEYINVFSVEEIKNSLKKIDGILHKSEVRDGSTLVLVMKQDDRIICCNIGDSRALLVKFDGSTVPLTCDHKPTDRSEFNRIRDRNSYISDGRIGGILAISRAIGDFVIPGISSEPDIHCHKIESDDYRLVLACDGVFDVLTNEEVGMIASEKQTATYVAYKIKMKSYSRLSQDNISVIVIDLQ